MSCSNGLKQPVIITENEHCNKKVREGEKKCLMSMKISLLLNS